MNPHVTILGAGLSGALMAIFLAHNERRVVIYERRPDLRKTVRFLAPLIAPVHCHSPSSRTRREHSWLERASPAALLPTSPRHKRLKSSSIGSLKPAEQANPRRTLQVKHFGAPDANRGNFALAR
jgi:glycine/D-amino acid oxidase-like deaminating enzyme